MWTREELKSRAKSVLKTNYWYGFAAVVIFLAISFMLNFIIGRHPRSGISYPFYDAWWYYLNPFASILAFFSGIISLLVAIFLTMPLAVGLRKYFIRASQYRVDLKHLFYSFDGDRYLPIVGTMFMQGLFIFLWTLLLIVPGIVKALSYSMVPFILTDNPHIGYDRALKLSRAMTQGEKGNIFVLGLSFLGWLLLAVIPWGLGIPFLLPYIDATFAELYAKLRINALNKGLCSYEELGFAKEDAHTF